MLASSEGPNFAEAHIRLSHKTNTYHDRRNIDTRVKGCHDHFIVIPATQIGNYMSSINTTPQAEPVLYAGRRKTSRHLVVAICFAAIIFDGYDLIVYGSTVPSLLAYGEWSLTATQVGTIGSYALMGMFFGAIGVGPLTDRFGRRKLFIASLVLYSVAMIFVAAAPTPFLLGVFRFIAGLGFGAIAPVAIALVIEVARPHERHRLNALMLAGFPIGGVLAALAALAFLDDVGFRGLWGFGAIALVTVVPLAWLYIPESAQINTAATKSAPVKQLVSRKEIRALALFAAANFMGFLLVFGLNTWLPQLMSSAGYGLSSALTFQLLLNFGAVAGGLAGATLADKFGSRFIAAGAFALAVVSIATMAAAPPTALLVVATILAGAGSIGTQVIVYGYVATYYATSVRATALGLTAGIGRLGAVTGPIVGGWLLANGFGNVWTFGFFGVTALLGGLACVLVPRRRQAAVEAEREHIASPAAPSRSDDHAS